MCHVRVGASRCHDRPRDVDTVAPVAAPGHGGRSCPIVAKTGVVTEVMVDDPQAPAGWYPDPAGRAQLRWWDGNGWTASYRPLQATDEAPDEAVAPGASPGVTRLPTVRQPRLPWPRRQVVAAAVIGGFLLVTIGIVAALVIADRGSDRTPTIDDLLTSDLDGDSESDEGEGSSDDSDEADPEASAEDDDLDAGDGSAAGDPDDPQGDADDAEPDAGDREAIEVDFDGVCVVTLDPDSSDGATGTDDADDPGALRPWHFRECERAPVALDDGDRWIVVVASFGTEGMTEDEAVTRSEGSGHGLLWSSHYPSLNPGLWVLYDGPYDDERDASEAARQLGGGSYPRVLSDDEGDRYCVAADGCVGDTPRN